jgi:hypothetical protein
MVKHAANASLMRVHTVIGRSRVDCDTWTRRAKLSVKRELASMNTIHLCGSGAGNAYARRGFRLRRGQRCGDHDPRRYLAEVNALKRQFVRLAASG